MIVVIVNIPRCKTAAVGDINQPLLGVVHIIAIVVTGTVTA